MVDSFARRKLLGIVSGGVLAQCCYALAKLGVPDLLAGGPRSVAELAAACGAQEQVLHRMLRGLTSMGLFRRTGPQTYALTSVSELLRSDMPGSLRSTAVIHGEEVLRSLAEIMYTMRTGEPAFGKVHGEPFYTYLAGHPDAAATFAEAMGSQRVPAALAGCDLTGVSTLVDLGGGDGGLVAEFLGSHPGSRAVLADLPDAIRAARAKLTDAGLADRVDLVEGSFFDQVPAGGDAYVLARVLHNWSDEHAETLLARVHGAMAPGARLIVLEEFLPEEGDEGGPASAGMVDLLMLVMLEGHDRTEAGYRALLDRTGFEVAIVRPATGAGQQSAIEAVRR
jgi:O-methyltransferase domain/Dimerisation domain